MGRKITSRYLTYLLRHHPEEISLELDRYGWTKIEQLVVSLRRHDCDVLLADLLQVFALDLKRRFTVSEDGTEVRAAQGHSIEVDLGLTASEPPAILFHGTAARFVNGILANGIHPGSRQHVHLSLDREAALAVGTRHGRPKVLSIDAGRMFADGHKFYLSENGVWLTVFIARIYITTTD